MPVRSCAAMCSSCRLEQENPHKPSRGNEKDHMPTRLLRCGRAADLDAAVPPPAGLPLARVLPTGRLQQWQPLA